MPCIDVRKLATVIAARKRNLEVLASDSSYRPVVVSSSDDNISSKQDTEGTSLQLDLSNTTSALPTPSVLLRSTCSPISEASISDEKRLEKEYNLDSDSDDDGGRIDANRGDSRDRGDCGGGNGGQWQEAEAQSPGGPCRFSGDDCHKEKEEGIVRSSEKEAGRALFSKRKRSICVEEEECEWQDEHSESCDSNCEKKPRIDGDDSAGQG
jgi:hypothetical protein